MDEIYFQGVWRMDWGLGNPNKTAALIAFLMLAIWTLPLLRRWLFWVALPAFTALGVCLIHTMSRGGVVAAVAGFALLLVHLRRVRPWPRARVLPLAGAVAVMLAGAGTYQTSVRFAQSGQDRSISNRLTLWKQAPRMMVDAPWGWGVGNSGRAYMSWYQPLDTTEQYRTLVNSHLTWFVEWGWPLRWLYALGWAAVFVLCCGSRRFESPKPFLFCGMVCGLWTVFFVASAFSSVAEAPQLFVLPVLGLAGVLIVRSKQHRWPSRLAWASGAAGVVLILGTLAVCGYVTAPPAGAGRLGVLRNGTVCVGAQPPKTWVVVGNDPAIIGETYPRSYRDQKAHPSVGFVSSLAALPSDLTGCKLAVIGTLNDWSALAARAKKCEALLLIAPDAFPEAVNLPKGIPTRVVFGEFSNRPSAIAWRGTGLTQTREGVGEFFYDWPEIVFGTLK